MSEKDVDVNESEEAGEKKVTFNETTEEKNYTKDKEVDEEGQPKPQNMADVLGTRAKKTPRRRRYKRVERHAIDNQTNDKGVSQTVTQKADSEREERSPEYKTDDEKRDDLNNDIQQTNDDGLGANNISDEEKGQKNVSVDDDKTETEANTDNNRGDPDTQFRFNITNEQKLKEDHENTFDNYFHDTVIDDSEANDNQIPMQSSQKTDEREDKHETMKDNTVDYKSNAVDDYDKRTRKQSRNETDGEITIVTKKKVPPKEMTIMTDEEKSELKETEDSKVKASTTDATQRSEEPKKSEHRCPSPSTSSSVESEPHIVTKKKGDQREEEQKEPERWASDARKENTGHSSNKADAKSAKGGAEVTPKQAQIADNKSTSPKRTIHQTPTRTESPRNIAAHARKQNPRMAKSAGPGGRPTFSRTSSTATSARSPSRWSRPRTCGYREEERRRKEREFFTAELERLKKSLKRDSSKIKKPKPKDHYPYVFTSLEPYYNTYTPQYLIGMPDTGYPVKQPPEVEMTMKEMKEHKDRNHGEDKELMYTSRCTAIGLTDPWDSLHMDKSVLPKLETSEMRRRRMEKMHEQPRSPSAKQKRPEAKQGSTRLPKFPVISLSNQDLATKELIYTDIPMLRDELTRSFSHQEGGRKKDDYTRTRQDFYRMELDRITEMHKSSRPHMRAAYFAYLQNTPGSREAVYQCLRELNKKKPKQTPQAVA